MTIPQDVAADPWQIVADLQQRIAASHAEREILELALRESEQRYALAMRAINEGFYEWDVVTSEMRYSPRVCELVGLAPEELRTMADWTDRVHPTDMPGFRKAILAHFKGETEWLEAEYRYRHADGTWHWARQHGIGLRNDAGRVYRVVGSTGDITAQKAAEEALRESLEQQTATAEVLQVINSSPGDLTPVFDAMLERATRLCDAPCAMLWTYDGEAFSAPATFGVPEAFAEYLRKPLEIQPSVFLGALRHGETFVHNLDLADTSSYRGGNPLNRAVVDLGGARTGLLVPLQKDGRLLGAFRIYRHEMRPFTDKQIALLQNFAAQAVIAMENARLITETREALEQQTATAEVLQVINRSPGDLAPVFDAMLDKALNLCEAALGTLLRFDGQAFHWVAARGVPDHWLTDSSFGPGGSVPTPGLSLYRIIQGEDIVHTEDIIADDVYLAGNPMRRRWAELTGARTAVWVALRKDDALLGALIIYRQEVRPFTDKQIALLQNFAAQAVIAMENARLLDELRQRTDEVAELNRGLEARVAEQVEELGRVGRLKRFLAPQLAELIVSQGDEKILESHRREIVVVFCDLRGYTAFTETAEPEEVLDFLREYHGALGPLVSQYEGTLDQFSGDGIMVFFNDPVPCPDPAERAVKMAMAMREAASKLIATWRRDGCELGFGAGIAQGYATLGQIGFSERSGYTAIGTVCNLAARLCAEAKDGQILISSRVGRAVEAVARLEDLGNLELRGLRRPVAAFNVVRDSSAAEARPNLTVVARDPSA
jgi:PAS domain S-box-containing protein